MPETTPKFELAEPPDPTSLLPDFAFAPWMVPAGLVVLLGLLALVLIIAKLRRNLAKKPESLRHQAYQEATRALGGIEVSTPREAAVRASLIVRKYLAVAAEDPALFETHEEFISRQDSLQQLTPDARAASESGFARLAALKYAPHAAYATVTPQEVIGESRVLLETLHHGFSA